MRRDEIKAVAQDLFSKKGYHDASMADIANIMGVTKTALYFHFRNKMDLFSESLTDTLHALVETLRGAAAQKADAGLEQQLKAVYLAFAAELPVDKILLWKRTRLMCTADFDPDIRLQARKAVDSFNTAIYSVPSDIILSKNPGLKRVYVNAFTDCFMLLVMGLTDFLLDNSTAADHKDASKIAAQVWACFWAGSRSLIGG